MSRFHIADTGLFVAMGQPSNSRYQAVRRFARRNDVTFVLPERVYEELTVDDQDVEAQPVDTAIEEGWATVASPLEFSEPVVSRVMDGVQRYIANADDRPADEDFAFRMAHLQYRDGDWYLHASMRKVEANEEPSESESKHRTVLGVDLGVNNLAVASTGRFWSADEFNHWRREYEKRRASLQQCGSRHAHENIESVGQKEYGRFEIYLHTVANELIEEAVENDCSHIVFEDLTHIRENIPEATWQHVWAFRRLSEYVEYKVKEQGVEVVHVDPRNTSKRCSTCGFTHDDNRHGEDFECQQCGYENHADYNAAKNIDLQYLRRRQNADDGGAPVDVRLNRGTLNVSGEYVPPASAEA